jgi:hypothetical protein
MDVEEQRADRIAVRVSATPLELTSEFQTLVQVQRNDAGDIVVTWHPNIMAEPDPIIAVLRALSDAAAESLKAAQDTSHFSIGSVDKPRSEAQS